MLFKDRADAGRRLATLLGDYRGSRPIVLGLPRGGVPVAYEVAQALQAPLDVAVVRKVGAPDQPELALGAVAEDGVFVVNDDVRQAYALDNKQLEALAAAKHAEVAERVRKFHQGRPAQLAGRTVILVDDGIATGATALAAVAWVRRQRPARVVLAAGVVPQDSVSRLRKAVDALVYVHAVRPFGAVGHWYDEFRQVTDAEVVALLQRAAEAHGRPPRLPQPGASMPSRPIAVPVGDIRLAGDLTVPSAAGGLVIFAHGSGSSRHSPRNQMVASALQARGLATLLFDLLTEAEGRDEDAGAMQRFDIPFLARRLEAVVRWCMAQPGTSHLRIGLFGASTGAAAALVAAASLPGSIQAVVSRGGRPDLAAEALPRVLAPTLLLVGGEDRPVIGMNREAFERLRCEKKVLIVPGATHLFEEPGALEEVANLAGAWFVAHLGANPSNPS